MSIDCKSERNNQENVEEEIDEDNENIKELKNNSKNIEIPSIEIPIDDLLDNPAIAGIGFVVCVLKCCAPNKRRRKKKKNRYCKEIEIGRTSYRDNFEDEGLDEYNDGQYSDSDEDYLGKGLKTY